MFQNAEKSRKFHADTDADADVRFNPPYWASSW